MFSLIGAGIINYGEMVLMLPETLSVLFALLVSIGIPLGALIYFISRRNGYVKPFMMGAITFTLFQMLIRIPLLQNVLPDFSWFLSLQAFYPILYLAFLALTAALFEEGGRFIIMKLFMRRNNRRADGISFGFGHGGIEAVLFLGVNLIALLVSSGWADIIGKETDIIWGGIERLLVIPLHIAWSVMVLQGIVRRRGGYLLMAVFTHFLVDFVPFLIRYRYGISNLSFESILTIFTVTAIIYTIKSGRSFRLNQYITGHNSNRYY